MCSFQTSAFSQQNEKKNKERKALGKRKEESEKSLKELFKGQTDRSGNPRCGRSNRLYRGSMTSLLKNKRFNIIKHIIAGFIADFIIKLDVSVSKGAHIALMVSTW